MNFSSFASSDLHHQHWTLVWNSSTRNMLTRPLFLSNFRKPFPFTSSLSFRCLLFPISKDYYWIVTILFLNISNQFEFRIFSIQKLIKGKPWEENLIVGWAQLIVDVQCRLRVIRKIYYIDCFAVECRRKCLPFDDIVIINDCLFFSLPLSLLNNTFASFRIFFAYVCSGT